MRQEDVLQVMDLARVVSDRKLKGSGLNRGDVVVVVGTRQVPASAKDLYLHRVLTNVALVRDKEILKDSMYLVDPRSLEKISDETEIRKLLGDVSI